MISILVLALLVWDGVAWADTTLDQQLDEAVKKGDVALIKTLLDKGASVNPVDKRSRTPLMDAAFEGHLEVVKLLLEKGAAVTAEDYLNQTALSYAAFRGHVKVVTLLKKRGAHMDLRIAAMLGDLAEAGRLISEGADVNAKYEGERTALSFAAERGATDVAAYLEAHGAK